MISRLFKSGELDTQNFDREFIREKIDLTPVDNAFIKNIDQTVRFSKIRNVLIIIKYRMFKFDFNNKINCKNLGI